MGGGVCQSSTTVYRGVLNAGLQVTERRNHTLDVVYYHEYGYGLDATVYTDARSDLRFVNDYPTPLLVNAYLDGDKKEAVIEFYGTADGRKVELREKSTTKPLYKEWDWVVTWPDRAEERIIRSQYEPEKELEEL